MKIDLLVLDVDGTLTADLNTVSPAVQAAIRAAEAAGVRVTLATGREYRTTVPFAQLLGLQTPLICYQGGLVKDHRSGEVWLDRFVPPVLARRVIRYARAKQIPLILYVNDDILTEFPSEEMVALFEKVGNPVGIVNNLLSAIDDDTALPIKFLVVDTVANCDAMILQLRQKFGNTLSILKSLPTVVEATLPDMSKGVALQELARRLDIPAARVMVMGDQDNDLAMLEWAGFGVAMGNASAAAKAAADVIAPPVTEDGVAWAIETYILPPASTLVDDHVDSS